jgi:hypothetical protein
MKKIFNECRGQAMVLYLGVIATVLGAVALGADCAVMYMNWQQVQKTADAAAIAGANFLTSGMTFGGPASAGCTGDDAEKAACTYAVENGLAVSNVAITEPTGSTIQVIASETSLPYFFGKAIGLSTYDVKATAIAQAPGVVGTVTQGMFPVGLQCTNPCTLSSLDPGQSVSFGQKFVGGLAPGNWQFLDVSGGHSGGDTLLASAIQYGATTSFSTGGTIYSEPGNKGKSGPIKSAFAARMSACNSISDPCTSAGGNPTNIPAGDPCLVVVPAVDYHGCSGSCGLTIEGFALVYIEPSASTSTSINGCFVKAIKADTITSSTAPALGALVTDTLTL